MGEKQDSEPQSVPIALRFEASPDLKHSFNQLVVYRRRQLASTALYLYVEGSGDLLDEVTNKGDPSEEVQRAVDHYNWLLSRPVGGTMLYYRELPVIGVEHFPSDDGENIDFSIRVRTTTQEMNRLRHAPFTEKIGSELVLPHQQPRADMQPLPQRAAAYQEIRRRALGRGSLFVTHPTAVVLPPRVNGRLVH